MKYQAPAGCEGVTLFEKWYPVENGVVDVPNIPHDLEANGFKPVTGNAAPVAPAETAEVEPVAKKATKKESE